MGKIIINDINELDLLKKNSIVDFFYLNKNLDLELLYNSYFDNTNKLREFVSFLFKEIGISSLAIFRVILIIDELNNNAIEYGSQEGEINKLRIKLRNLKDYNYNLVLEVEDTGNGYFSKNSKEMKVVEKQKHKKGFNNGTIRGRGLLIIKNIVDNLYFKDSDDGGLIVGIEKEIKLEKIK